MLKKPSEKSSKERKLPSPRSKARERQSTRTRPPNRRLKTRQPKKPKRKPKRPPNDLSLFKLVLLSAYTIY